MSHIIVSSLPPLENCQGSVEDDISQRAKKKKEKKISRTPYLSSVREKHSSTNLTLSLVNLSPFLRCLCDIVMAARKRAQGLESDGFGCVPVYYSIFRSLSILICKISIILVMLVLQRDLRTKGVER